MPRLRKGGRKKKIIIEKPYTCIGAYKVERNMKQYA